MNIENNGVGLNHNFINDLRRSLLGVHFPRPNQRIQFELSNQIIQRFQLGFHALRVNAIIYIVAIERETINPNYLSMPELDKLVGHFCLLNWLQVPVLVLGINCSGN